jgi:F420H(2)-dependent quinone reductase
MSPRRARSLKRWATRSHAWLYRRTAGRVLGRLGNQPVLLLQTTGRRSGRRRTTPVQYLPRGESFVVVAANGGAPRAPAWCANLRADARGRIQVGARVLDVLAREVTGEERVELWTELQRTNPHLGRVAAKANRQLPLLVLTPPS